MKCNSAEIILVETSLCLPEKCQPISLFSPRHDRRDMEALYSPTKYRSGYSFCVEKEFT